MGTYAEMRTRILDELANDGDLTVAQVNNAIQDAIKFYERNEWWFNSNVTTFSTVADQETYSLSNFGDLPNTVSILAMNVTFNNIKSPLRGVDYLQIDDAQSGFVKGIPRYFSYFDQVLRFFPIPNGNYTMTISYVYKLPTLANDSDTNAWLNDAEELIRQSAKRRLCLNILFADEIATRCGVLEKESYDAIRQENRMRRSQQELRTQLPLSRRPFNIYTG